MDDGNWAWALFKQLFEMSRAVHNCYGLTFLTCSFLDSEFPQTFIISNPLTAFPDMSSSSPLGDGRAGFISCGGK